MLLLPLHHKSRSMSTSSSPPPPRKRNREDDREEEQEDNRTKRPREVSCHYQESEFPDGGTEISPVHVDTVILSKSSLDSSKSYEWFSSQVSTPVPAEPVSTISIDHTTPAPPTLDASLAYLPAVDSHRHSHTMQQHRQQQAHTYPTSQPQQDTSYISHPAHSSMEYSAYHHNHNPHQPYSNRQLPYVDYTPYHREPYISPNQAPVQPHVYSSYDESVAYHHHHSPPPSSYYSYPYPPPVEYSYYHAYYSSDPRMYSSSHTGVPSNYSSMKPESMSHMQQRPPEDPRTAGISLYLPCDESTLSAYQCLVRQQIEFFAASPMDVDQTIQGRNKKIEPGQVGIRCRHCKHIPIKRRARGAMYYPSKLSCIYQMAQNMATVHINQACEHVPAYLREAMEQSVSDRKSLAGSGKEYWATGARSLGVVETNGRLMFVEK